MDEFACIGCRNCTNVCGKTFELEDDFGRARAVSQRHADIDTKQEAIDTCPVRRISAAPLPFMSVHHCKLCTVLSCQDIGMVGLSPEL